MRTANWDVSRLAKMITKEMTVVIEGPAAEPRPVLAKNDAHTTTPAATAPQPAAQPQHKFKWFWQK
jgi:hypothetical protein